MSAALHGLDPCPSPTLEKKHTYFAWLMPPAEQTIAITKWGDFDTKKDLRPIDSRETLRWSEIVAWISVGAPRPPKYARACAGGDPKKAADLPAWSPAVFEHSSGEDPTKGIRQIPNVVHVTALAVDIDAGSHPIEVIRDAFEGRRAVFHSTRSYTIDKPRWHVVSAISRPMTRDEHAAVWRAERERLVRLGITIDSAAKDPSRLLARARCGRLVHRRGARG